MRDRAATTLTPRTRPRPELRREGPVRRPACGALGVSPEAQHSRGEGRFRPRGHPCSVYELTANDRTTERWLYHSGRNVVPMLYGLVVLLLVIAVVLFLAKVAVGGGIFGILA